MAARVLPTMLHRENSNTTESRAVQQLRQMVEMFQHEFVNILKFTYYKIHVYAQEKQTYIQPKPI